MPLNSSLDKRSTKFIWGEKHELTIRKELLVTGVFSEQKSQTKTVTSQGGGTIQNFRTFCSRI